MPASTEAIKQFRALCLQELPNFNGVDASILKRSLQSTQDSKGNKIEIVEIRKYLDNPLVTSDEMNACYGKDDKPLPLLLLNYRLKQLEDAVSLPNATKDEKKIFAQKTLDATHETNALKFSNVLRLHYKIQNTKYEYTGDPLTDARLSLPHMLQEKFLQHERDLEEMRTEAPSKEDPLKIEDQIERLDGLADSLISVQKILTDIPNSSDEGFTVKKSDLEKTAKEKKEALLRSMNEVVRYIGTLADSNEKKLAFESKKSELLKKLQVLDPVLDLQFLQAALDDHFTLKAALQPPIEANHQKAPPLIVAAKPSAVNAAPKPLYVDIGRVPGDRNPQQSATFLKTTPTGDLVLLTESTSTDLNSKNSDFERISAAHGNVPILIKQGTAYTLYSKKRVENPLSQLTASDVAEFNGLRFPELGAPSKILEVDYTPRRKDIIAKHLKLPAAPLKDKPRTTVATDLGPLVLHTEPASVDLKTITSKFEAHSKAHHDAPVLVQQGETQTIYARDQKGKWALSKLQPYEAEVFNLPFPADEKSAAIPLTAYTTARKALVDKYHRPLTHTLQVDSLPPRLQDHTRLKPSDIATRSERAEEYARLEFALASGEANGLFGKETSKEHTTSTYTTLNEKNANLYSAAHDTAHPSDLGAPIPYPRFEKHHAASDDAQSAAVLYNNSAAKLMTGGSDRLCMSGALHLVKEAIEIAATKKLDLSEVTFNIRLDHTLDIRTDEQLANLLLAQITAFNAYGLSIAVKWDEFETKFNKMHNEKPNTSFHEAIVKKMSVERIAALTNILLAPPPKNVKGGQLQKANTIGSKINATLNAKTPVPFDLSFD